MDIGPLIIIGLVILSIFSTVGDSDVGSTGAQLPQETKEAMVVEKSGEVPSFSPDDSVIKESGKVANLPEVNKDLKQVSEAMGASSDGEQVTPAKEKDLVGKIYQAIKNFILRHAKKIAEEEAKLIANYITQYSEEFKTDPVLMTAVIGRESRFNAKATSYAGAQGLGQLMPKTLKKLGINNPYDIEENIKATCRYMKLMLERWEEHKYQIPLALASYKEGYNRVKENGGVYSSHTQKYINDIVELYNEMSVNGPLVLD